MLFLLTIKHGGVGGDIAYVVRNCSLFSRMLLVCARFSAVFRTSLAFDAGFYSVIHLVSENGIGEGGLVGMLCVLWSRCCES